MTRIPAMRPGQRHRRHLPRGLRRRVRLPRLRARHHAAGRTSANSKTLLARFQDQRAAARQRRLGRQLGHRLLAARRLRPRSSAASATTATASSTNRVRGAGHRHRQSRSSSARPPAPASASSRPTPSAPCAPAWPCRAISPPATSTRSASRTPNGCSSRATSSPIRKPAKAAIREAIRLAKKHGTKIALTCSDAFVVQRLRRAFRAALEQADLLFANETEACRHRRRDDRGGSVPASCKGDGAVGAW